MSKSLLFVTLTAAADDPLAQCKALKKLYPTVFNQGGRVLSQSSGLPGQALFDKSTEFKVKGDDFITASEKLMQSATLKCNGEAKKAEAMKVITAAPDELRMILSRPRKECDRIILDRTYAKYEYIGGKKLQEACHISSRIIDEMWDFKGEPMWTELLEKVNELLDPESPDKAAPKQIWSNQYSGLWSEGFSDKSKGKKITDDNPGNDMGEISEARKEGKALIRMGTAKHAEAKKVLRVKIIYDNILNDVKALKIKVTEAKKGHDDGEQICADSLQLMKDVQDDPALASLF